MHIIAQGLMESEKIVVEIQCLSVGEISSSSGSNGSGGGGGGGGDGDGSSSSNSSFFYIKHSY